MELPREPYPLSIVIATYPRRSRIEACVRAVRANVRPPYELIVVDGGSTDGTREWLREQPDVRLHVETPRAGCCRAYDLGLRLATGRYVTWLNDDSVPSPGAYDAAMELLERPDMRDAGMVALYHTHHDPWNELHGFDANGQRWGVLHVRGWPYANFGVLRRSLLAQLGYLDTRYYFCGWDPDLALKVQRDARLHVLSTPAACVRHEELRDARKLSDADARARDNRRLFEKWKLPAKGAFPDPRPGYAALLTRRGLIGNPAAFAGCGAG